MPMAGSRSRIRAPETRREAAVGERRIATAPSVRVAEDGMFSGYASLFDEPDLGKDVIERGAFAASLRARGAGGVRMLFQHDPAQPIGAWTELREDERGLFVRGRLDLGVQRAREVYSLLKGGALDGLSIGFRTVRARHDRDAGLRRIVEADLWEISVVTFPMQPLARVRSVKSGLAEKVRAVAMGMARPQRADVTGRTERRSTSQAWQLCFKRSVFGPGSLR